MMYPFITLDDNTQIDPSKSSSHAKPSSRMARLAFCGVSVAEL